MRIRWMINRRPTVHGYTRPNSRDLMLNLWQIDIEADNGNGLWRKWGEIRIDPHTSNALVRLRGYAKSKTKVYQIDTPTTHDDLWNALDTVVARVAKREGWEIKIRRKAT